MGWRDKRRSKDLREQAYDKLTGMLALGESKKDAIAAGTDRDKIFSRNTYRSYWQHTRTFCGWMKQEHPEVRKLKHARPYVREWLETQVAEGKSAWTIQTQAKALSKLYGITPEDTDYYTPPVRHREDIKRSRGPVERDRHFSVTNNDELIRFCRGTGCRREGLTKLRGRDLMTREAIQAQVDRLAYFEGINFGMSDVDRKELRICRDALMFDGCEYFLRLREKGGRERISPIIGPDTDAIVERIRSTAPDDHVWQHVHSGADIHGYRGDYAKAIYRQYARPIEEIPYDRIHAGTGRAYQSEVYHCRVDERGKKLDKRAMLMASKALGHNRIEVVANNYIRGL